MAKPVPFPLCEKVSCKSIIERTSNVIVFCLYLCLFSYRLHSFGIQQGFTWLLAFLCESWFTFIWLINLITRWSPAEHKTYPDNLWAQLLELPPVDIFVTTADPVLEPPLVTVNTVLSLLAVDYPAEKLACYVSDDGCSPLTFYSLVEASKFAQLWVPFCNKYNVQVRAPFLYFSAKPLPPGHLHDLPGFKLEWKKMKDEYDQLCGKIENGARSLKLGPQSSEYLAFLNTERNNHPSIVKVIWENRKDQSSVLPHLIYIAREKRPNHPHHYKAGAMNVLTRVSGLMTNSPFMLNVDCDMFASNPKIIQHGVCSLLGDEECGFAECVYAFYNELEDDPFGNQLLQILVGGFGGGMAGIQGPPYYGTGCFHRRKTIYGLPPDYFTDHLEGNKNLEERFGSSPELSKSVAEILFGSGGNFSLDVSGTIESACRVADCGYENNTCWGREVGFGYGSLAEDALTGLKIHKMGWKSVFLMLSQPAFTGCAAQDGPLIMTQMKRWGTGLLEVFFGKHSPIFSAFASKLYFRQPLAYLSFLLWAFGSIPDFLYTLLSAYCIINNTYFLPKVKEPTIYIPVSIFIINKLQLLALYLVLGKSVRAWWNGHRMERIVTLSSMLLASLTVFLKLLGLRETVFEVTQKSSQQSSSSDRDETVGRFTFNKSPIFVPGTTLLLVHLAALATWAFGWQPAAPGGDGSGVGEILCSIWVVLNFWPFLRGLFGKGKYGIPRSTIWKSAALALLFLHLSKAGTFVDSNLIT